MIFYSSSLIISITLTLLKNPVFVSAQTQESLFNVTCKDGYKLAGIARAPPTSSGRVGPLTCICEQIVDVAESNTRPVCEQMGTSLKCDGSLEGCTGNSYMGGFTGLELSRDTGAMSLKPICCSDPRVRIVEGTCANVRLNALRSAFDVVLRPVRVIREWQCWKIQSRQQETVDFIWKVNVCDWASEHKADFLRAYPRDDQCGNCDCECSDPVECPSSTRYRAMRIHRTRQPGTCQCQCQCDQICA